MRVAVTGGTGVVGGSVVRHLINAGHEVRALVRSKEGADDMAALGAVPAFGDVLDPHSLDSLVATCEVVFHVAGVNELCSNDVAAMWRVNVEGSRMVLEASRAAGVRRLIHTSSAVTTGAPVGVVATEETPHRNSYLTDYEESKTVAERLLRAQAGEFEVVFVNPSSVQGPGRATGTGALLLAASRGRIPVVFDSTISIVDIDDCAKGHLLAAENGVPGRRYLLSGATLTVEDVIEAIDEITGNSSHPRRVKYWQLKSVSVIVSAGYGLLRRQPPICNETVRVMTHGHRYDGSRAQRELGLTYTPIAETFARTVDWFRSEGLLA